MINSVLLFIIIGLLTLLSIVFWPENGLFWKWKLTKNNNERILLEDALKVIFNYEYKQRKGTLRDISDSLGIDDSSFKPILEKLTEAGLVTILNDEINLTDDGRSYALKIVRIHRVWERYLSENTGLNSGIWHSEADKKEHFISDFDIDILAADMGNPVFDPHGDPIPSEFGELPEYKGNSLNDFDHGDYVKIVHIEDEPPIVYSQLVAMGLYPGMILYISGNDDKKVKFIANGEESILADALAENITVVKINDSEHNNFRKRLSTLSPGQEAIITGISPNCRGLERRRMMDLGIVQGTGIKVLMKSPGGDPTAYEVLGAGIALRKNQAENIFVTEKTEQ